jgi:hypothetical protein
MTAEISNYKSLQIFVYRLVALAFRWQYFKKARQYFKGNILKLPGVKMN